MAAHYTAVAMNRFAPAFLLAGLLYGPAAIASPAQADLSPANLATACAGNTEWDAPAPPARLFGNTWYVGTCGITAILVTSPQGHILVDGGVAKAAPLVLANIRRSGFAVKDVRWIVATHEHYDHVGALAALKRATGAKVAALAVQRRALESGKPSADDPQFAKLDPIEPVRVDRTLRDGDIVSVGPLKLTAHATPVHAPGSTSWTWRSCAAPTTCQTIAYADSTSTISSEEYRFTDHPKRIATVRRSLPRVANLPCHILITPHPQQSAMMDRFAGTRPLVDASACRAYVAAAETRFAQRLSQEAKEPK